MMCSPHTLCTLVIKGKYKQKLCVYKTTPQGSFNLLLFSIKVQLFLIFLLASHGSSLGSKLLHFLRLKMSTFT